MRVVIGLLVVAVLVAAAVFFADHPGRVEIVWRGWQVETSVGVLVAAAILAGLAAAFVSWLAALILGSPRAFLRRRRERRRRAGYRALTQGMVAVAAGDPQEARRHARKADALLADPPLTLLLSAQAAQLDGDEAAAKKFFTAMLDRPETEFLGLRGLLNHALRAGDRGTALRLAERAKVLRPNTRWVSRSLFDLEVRAGRWEAARDTLAQAAKRGIVTPQRARHHRGILLYELSRAILGVDRRRGLALAAEARALTPDLPAPAAHYARLLLEERRARPAAKVVQRAWRTAPHPELAQVYGAIFGDDPPLARVKCFERLAAENPAARESHVALAEAALDARLWGEARRHLERALVAPAPPRPNPPAATAAADPVADWTADRSAHAAIGKRADDDGLAGPTPRLCRLMARLEEAEHGGQGLAREWLDRAVVAMPDPRYLCANCGGESLDWRSLCPHCGSFDALAWRTPGWATTPAERLPIAAPSRSAAELSVANTTDG